MGKDDFAYVRRNRGDRIRWVRKRNYREGEWLFTFDKKTVYNMFEDYPHKLPPNRLRSLTQKIPVGQSSSGTEKNNTGAGLKDPVSWDRHGQSAVSETGSVFTMREEGSGFSETVCASVFSTAPENGQCWTLAPAASRRCRNQELRCPGARAMRS